jgi:hypothetical protein
MQLFNIFVSMAAASAVVGAVNLPELDGRALRFSEPVTETPISAATSTSMASGDLTAIMASTLSPTSSAILPTQGGSIVVLELSNGPGDALFNITELSTIAVTECTASTSQGLHNVDTLSVG